MEGVFAGHNNIQLFYPIRAADPKSTLEKVLPNQRWGKDDGNYYGKYVFPRGYFYDEKTFEFASGISGFERSRASFEEKYVNKFFHPSVQTAIFSGDKVGKFSLPHGTEDEPDLFVAKLFSCSGESNKKQEGIVVFELVHSEIFRFSASHAVLMVRLAMLENYVFRDKSEPKNELCFSRNLGEVVEKNCQLQTWMRFTESIRVIHDKYKGQNFLKVFEVSNRDFRRSDFPGNQDEVYILDKGEEKDFIDVVQELLGRDLIIRDVSKATQGTPKKAKKLKTERLPESESPPKIDESEVEPNAFLHSFIQWESPTSKSLSDEEVFAVMCVDAGTGGSSSNKEFVRLFTAQHSLQRWAPWSIYTGLDYAAVTLVKSRPRYLCSSESESSVSRFPDILYQHHARQYLWFILLQLYYRGELHDLSGRYSEVRLLSELKKNIWEKSIGSKLSPKERREASKQARFVLDSYYSLNQTFFFERVTNEIQGAELWKHYQTVMGISELYKTVKEDMRELNQRLIESSSDAQNRSIKRLTGVGVGLALLQIVGLVPVLQQFFIGVGLDLIRILLKILSAVR